MLSLLCYNFDDNLSRCTMANINHVKDIIPRWFVNNQIRLFFVVMFFWLAHVPKNRLNICTDDTIVENSVIVHALMMVVDRYRMPVDFIGHMYMCILISSTFQKVTYLTHMYKMQPGLHVCYWAILYIYRYNYRERRTILMFFLSKLYVFKSYIITFNIHNTIHGVFTHTRLIQWCSKNFLKTLPII